MSAAPDISGVQSWGSLFNVLGRAAARCSDTAMSNTNLNMLSRLKAIEGKKVRFHRPMGSSTSLNRAFPGGGAGSTTLRRSRSHSHSLVLPSFLEGHSRPFSAISSLHRVSC